MAALSSFMGAGPATARRAAWTGLRGAWKNQRPPTAPGMSGVLSPLSKDRAGPNTREGCSGEQQLILQPTTRAQSNKHRKIPSSAHAQTLSLTSEATEDASCSSSRMSIPSTAPWSCMLAWLRLKQEPVGVTWKLMLPITGWKPEVWRDRWRRYW